MKHHHDCHCGFEKHLAKFRRGRKLGILGAVLISLHILWHVAECLILPAIFVAFSHHHQETIATGDDVEYKYIAIEQMEDFTDSLPYRGELPNVSTAAAWLYPPAVPDMIRGSFE